MPRKTIRLLLMPLCLVTLVGVLLTAAAGCGSKPTTTTAAPTTTATAAPTSTTGASKSTTTTAKPTSTTAKPTSTTAKPTTTTAKPTTTTAASQVVKVTEKEDGSIVRVAGGYVIELTLKGNPSTGYEWRNLKFEDSVLQLTTPTPKYVADSDQTGSGGKYTWKFKVVGQGGTDLKIDYVGPDSSVDHSFTCQVQSE